MLSGRPYGREDLWRKMRVLHTENIEFGNCSNGGRGMKGGGHIDPPGVKLFPANPPPPLKIGKYGGIPAVFTIFILYYTVRKRAVCKCYHIQGGLGTFFNFPHKKNKRNLLDTSICIFSEY